MLKRLERCALQTCRIALYGAGVHTERLLRLLADARAIGRKMPDVTLILDDHPTAETVGGVPIREPAPEMSANLDAIVLSTDYFQETLRHRCLEVFERTMPVIDLYEEFPWHRPGYSTA